ncbi:helix-turn-helix protein [Glutamicibacter mysorens]|uniref:Helix-turn-helix protein n=2 Tax=Glutamicibacter mysorens TaxID=257984 RepID=A0ABX4N1C2_9MICC|nr:helix-turn-helix protein [Glutamicibacter mysorens]
MTEFSAKLREAGLTNFHPTTVSRVERGERALKIDEIYVVAQVLNANLDDLIVIPYEEWEYAKGEVESNLRLVTNFAQLIAYWRWRFEDLVEGEYPVQLKKLEKFIADGLVPEDRRDEMHNLLEAARVAADMNRVDFWSEHLKNLESDEERIKFGRGLD